MIPPGTPEIVIENPTPTDNASACPGAIPTKPNAATIAASLVPHPETEIGSVETRNTNGKSPKASRKEMLTSIDQATWIAIVITPIWMIIANTIVTVCTRNERNTVRASLDNFCMPTMMRQPGKRLENLSADIRNIRPEMTKMHMTEIPAVAFCPGNILIKVPAVRATITNKATKATSRSQMTLLIAQPSDRPFLRPSHIRMASPPMDDGSI